MSGGQDSMRAIINRAESRSVLSLNWTLAREKESFFPSKQLSKAHHNLGGTSLQGSILVLLESMMELTSKTVGHLKT